MNDILNWQVSGVLPPMHTEYESHGQFELCMVCDKEYATAREWDDRHFSDAGDCHADCCPDCGDEG